MVTRPEFPYLFAVLFAYEVAGRRSPSFLSPWEGRGAAYFLRAYAGAPVTQTLRPSSLRIGERPCDTLRAHPENAAAPAQYPSAERRYRP